MKPYNEQLEEARRWDKVVDFGSPITAWTPGMLAARLQSKSEGSEVGVDVEAEQEQRDD